MGILGWLRWRRVGLDLRARRVWESFGFSAREAGEWLGAGGRNPGRAKAWAGDGVPTPQGAAPWLEAAVSPEEAAAWAAERFSPSDRQEWRGRGVVRPQDARAM